MDYREIKESIDLFAASISEEVATIRFYEVDRVKAVVATRLSAAIQDLMAISLDQLEQERIELVKKWSSPVLNGQYKQKLQGQLSVLKGRITQAKRVRGALQDVHTHQKFREYLNEKGLKHIYEEFLQTFDQPWNRNPEPPLKQP